MSPSVSKHSTTDAWDPRLKKPAICQCRAANAKATTAIANLMHTHHDWCEQVFDVSSCRLDNKRILKPISPIWCIKTTAEVSQLRCTCHFWYVQALVYIVFRWLTWLSRCAHNTSLHLGLSSRVCHCSMSLFDTHISPAGMQALAEVVCHWLTKLESWAYAALDMCRPWIMSLVLDDICRPMCAGYEWCS